MTDIRPIDLHDPGLLASLLDLNNAHARDLSLLDAVGLETLLRNAWHAGAIGSTDAFLIAFDQNGAYDSPNFLWFKAFYPRFVYVDRIAVAPSARGRGLARRLYADLFDRAAAAGHSVVCCEVNADPPNPGSDAFHEALGFGVVGRARIHDGMKGVRYFARALP